jgi:hypothetical protein
MGNSRDPIQYPIPWLQAEWIPAKFIAFSNDTAQFRLVRGCPILLDNLQQTLPREFKPAGGERFTVQCPAAPGASCRGGLRITKGSGMRQAMMTLNAQNAFW